ncbi:hypothetical protein GCM10022215_38320 [Nocardioides fonticola]|uniref:IrrE N-terminal-like domain-containing protein n=1 Tax=Nocardioides fonticola TaxID=450363 RepID=A0ABP7XYK8_9ACTN
MKTIEDCVAAALAGMAPDAQARFAVDPLATMRTDLGLKVTGADHLTEKRSDGGACDGLSFLKDGVILYAPTDNSRRENFTLAHELGHWLVEQVPEIFDWLFEQPAPERALETLCDQIAQRLLLAESSVSAIVGSGPIRARHVVDLYNATQASIPACAIALATRLPGLGTIIVVDTTTTFGEAENRAVVRYASVRPDPHKGWPKVYPWPGQTLPTGHPLQHLFSSAQTGPQQTAGVEIEPRALQQRSFWATPWGERATFYLDAVAVSARRVIGVLADTDLWGVERFHPTERRDFDQRPEQEITCCGQIRKVRGYPCERCGQIHCPVCGKCRCERRDDELVMCEGGCYLKFKPHLLVNGRCEDCR